MQRRLVAALVSVFLSVCFVALAGERGVDRRADRSRPGPGRIVADPTDRPDELPEGLRRVAQQFRLADRGALDKARALLGEAAGLDAPLAVSTLDRLLAMPLPDGPERNKLIAEVYRRLGDLYEGRAAKQVHLYGLALQHVADPARRDRLERRIEQLGGDVFALAFMGEAGAPTGPRDADDSCDGALALGPAPVTASGVFITPAGDHDWFSFQVPGMDGMALTIQTVSDQPGSFEDDTDLRLWEGCDAGTPTGYIDFNDDSPLANAPFMSRIDTDCLVPGTYYVEVGGFADISTPDNFELAIDVAEVCSLPVVDAFEPDDELAQANPIGHPTSTPAHANGWGRAKREIQSHSIFPPGDVDHAELVLTRNELVRMGTAARYPSPLNDFEGSAGAENPDTVLQVHYKNDLNYGGRCNEPEIGFIHFCRTDDDCSDNVGAPLPGFDPCISLCELLIYFQGPRLFCDNRLARNDDRAAGDLGSELLLCLPQTGPGTDSASANGPWAIVAEASSPADVFDYELQARNEVACPFEVEPNNDFPDAVPLVFGERVHGIFDFSETNPYQDVDLYRFDVEELREVILETDGHDDRVVDTALRLYVGPDDDGNYYTTPEEDDDGGPGLLSRIQVLLPPANDLLGNTVADADYFVSVSSDWLNPNFPYSLEGELGFRLLRETEPNDDCESNAQAVELQNLMVGDIDPACDFDAYKLTLDESTFVTLDVWSSGDTAMQLVDCADGSVLACDDDGGGGTDPLIQGCLPPAEYCIRLRAFSGYATLGYALDVDGTAGCSPTDPPSLTGDEMFTCSAFDTCP